MALDQVRDILHGTSPFTIHLVSGRKFRIRHPDYAALGTGDSSLIINDDSGHIELIRLNQIESISLGKKNAA
jgi:hypothetical protein